LNSRVTSLLFGRLDRADSELDHPGERPFHEYRQLLKSASFEIVRARGITLTIPLIIKLIRKFPSQFRWLHDLIGLFAFPSLSFLILFECRKNG